MIKTLKAMATIPPDVNYKPQDEMILEKAETVKQGILHQAREYINIEVTQLPDGTMEVRGYLRIYPTAGVTI